MDRQWNGIVSRSVVFATVYVSKVAPGCKFVTPFALAAEATRSGAGNLK